MDVYFISQRKGHRRMTDRDKTLKLIHDIEAGHSKIRELRNKIARLQRNVDYAEDELVAMGITVYPHDEKDWGNGMMKQPKEPKNG